MEETYSCKTCLFFAFADPEGGLGHCHRYPPSSNGFVYVNEVEWCGEYKHGSKEDGKN